METAEERDGALLTVATVAERLSVEAQTVRRWLRSGDLRGIALGGKSGWRITETDLAAFLESRRPKTGGGEDGRA
jgi:excisionase family DNA binding protein